jgi:hypothetical protein
MKGGNNSKNPLATFLSLFQAVCVYLPDNNDQRLRQTTTYHVILSSTTVFAADGSILIVNKRNKNLLLNYL